jgi:hypothetical protein
MLKAHLYSGAEYCMQISTANKFNAEQQERRVERLEHTEHIAKIIH